MWLERLTGEAVDLITLADAKDKLRIISPEGDDPELDAEVSRAIASASAALDVDQDGFGGLGFPLVAQQWRRYAATFDGQFLQLPFVRILSIDEIGYLDAEGVEMVVPAESYVLVGRGRGRSVELVSGSVWPAVANRPDAVRLKFTAGFETLEKVPEDLKAAARELVKFYYDCPLADAALGVPEQVQRGVDRLTRRYRAFAL
jgi:uncharacterized phiE125 gp8 family phage protein